jgi:hypothetical protein
MQASGERTPKAAIEHEVYRQSITLKLGDMEENAYRENLMNLCYNGK